MTRKVSVATMTKRKCTSFGKPDRGLQSPCTGSMSSQFRRMGVVSEDGEVMTFAESIGRAFDKVYEGTENQWAKIYGGSR